MTTITEQEWLGNRPDLSSPAPMPAQYTDAARGQQAAAELYAAAMLAAAADARAAVRAATTEAELIAGMRKALRPFPRPATEPKQGWDFPRAGVRVRPDGRYQLRIWLDPTLPDPVQGGPCETRTEAYNLGALICTLARAAA